MAVCVPCTPIPLRSIPNPLRSEGLYRADNAFQYKYNIKLNTGYISKEYCSRALDIITSTDISITTSTSALVNSDVSLGYANTTNPIINLIKLYSRYKLAQQECFFSSELTKQST
jgi:hypothetical protein